MYIQQVIDEWRKNNLKHEIIHRHDNAKLHTAGATINFLQSNDTTLRTYPTRLGSKYLICCFYGTENAVNALESHILSMDT